MNKIEYITTGRIFPSEKNPRKTMDRGELAELADSIKSIGMLQPITVRPTRGEGYEIVCGHRRFEAAKLAQLTEVPCIIRELSDQEAFEIMITENLQRKDINPFDESEAFIAMKDMGYDTEELSARFGKSKQYIYSRIKLGSLIPELKNIYDKGDMQLSHCMMISKLNADFQRELVGNYDGTGNSWQQYNKYTTAELKRALERECQSLENAIFDTTSCGSCPKNSACNLFGDLEGGLCEDSECFLDKRSEYIMGQLKIALKNNPELVICKYDKKYESGANLNLIERLEREKGLKLSDKVEYDFRNENNAGYSSWDGTRKGLIAFSINTGFKDSRREITNSIQNTCWTSDYTLDTIAKDYNGEMDGIKDGILNRKLSNLSLEQIGACITGNKEKAVMSKLILATMLDNCVLIEIPEIPEFKKFTDGEIDIDGFMEKCNPAIFNSLIIRLIIENYNLPYNSKIIRSTFSELCKGIDEEADREMLEKIKSCFHGYGVISDERARQEIEDRRKKLNEKGE